MPIRRKIFDKIHQLLGGHVQRLISGGSAIGNKELLPFFFSIGLPVYEGYGLTETGPTISSNTRAEHRLGSVGKPLPGLEVRIHQDGSPSSDGEILTRGPQVMLGYYKEADLTRATMAEDGWFRTGDTGYIDRDGYLYITGRIKRMIVLESGKKIHAEELEGVFSESPLFKEIGITGRQARRGKNAAEEVVAIVVPSDELRASFAHDEILIKQAVTQEIRKIAKLALADYKLPTLILIDNEELPKTSTMKLKMLALNERVEQLTSEQSLRPVSV